MVDSWSNLGSNCPSLVSIPNPSSNIWSALYSRINALYEIHVSEPRGALRKEELLETRIIINVTPLYEFQESSADGNFTSWSEITDVFQGLNHFPHAPVTPLVILTITERGNKRSASIHKSTGDSELSTEQLTEVQKERISEKTRVLKDSRSPSFPSRKRLLFSEAERKIWESCEEKCRLAPWNCWFLTSTETSTQKPWENRNEHPLPFFIRWSSTAPEHFLFSESIGITNYIPCESIPYVFFSFSTCRFLSNPYHSGA